MAKTQAVVISDVHIGNDTPTNWYQKKVHEQRLIFVLDWVIANAADIKELILLGDLVDIWTYPPSIKPPSMADIITANPDTLGPQGALQRAVQALPGAVTLLLGNHDGTLTQADIDTLQQAVGSLNYVKDGIHPVLSSDGTKKTVFAHGHFWTMFNAPDPQSPWNTLPIGHFVTRAFAYDLVAHRLQPGQTAADLPNMGSPVGFDIGPFLKSLSPTIAHPDIGSLLLNYVLKAANMKATEPIILPDGTTVTTQDAINAYAKLFDEWQQRWGTINAMRAAFADQWGDYLVWFAQRLAIEQNANLVVFGHTHQPIGGITPSPVNYVNSGYECPSVPDVPPAHFTFTLVDLDAASAAVFQTDGASVSDIHAPSKPVILPPFMDFSCYVQIKNNSGADMDRTSLPGPKHGYWVIPPPQTIPHGDSAMMWLQDYAGTEGTDGSVTYNNNLKFSFGCPTGLHWNWAAGPNKNFIAKSDANPWGNPGTVPKWGHPLQVRYY